MPDSYHLPALILTVLLLPAFLPALSALPRYPHPPLVPGLLLRRHPHVAVLQPRLVELHRYPRTSVDRLHRHVVHARQASSPLLASLSPLGFRIGRRPYPLCRSLRHSLVIYAFLIYGVYGGKTPAGYPFLIFPALGGLSLFAGCAGHSLTAAFLGPSPSSSASPWRRRSLDLCPRRWRLAPLFVECAIHRVTALLVFYVFRRISPEPSLPASASWPGR